MLKLIRRLLQLINLEQLINRTVSMKCLTDSRPCFNPKFCTRFELEFPTFFKLTGLLFSVITSRDKYS